MEFKKEEFIKKNEALCQEFGKNPYFEPEMVVGKPWRIYYTWNMRMETKCIDMKFKHATPMVSIIHFQSLKLSTVWFQFRDLKRPLRARSEFMPSSARARCVFAT